MIPNYDLTDLAIYDEPKYDKKKKNELVMPKTKVNILVKECMPIGSRIGGYFFFEKNLFLLSFDPENKNAEERFYSNHYMDFPEYIISRMKSYDEFKNSNYQLKKMYVDSKEIKSIKFEKDYYMVDEVRMNYSKNIVVEILVG
jgi:hypothetical protein